MKKNTLRKVMSIFLTAVLCLMMGFAAGSQNASAETMAAPEADNSPALYVAQKTVNSVVGIVTSAMDWDPSTRETVERTLSQGSGVCIREGGYVVTNYHVIEGGNTFQVIMPSGEKVEAKLVGEDSSTDLAVLQVAEEYRDQLIPVEVAFSAEVPVGATAIAIGNPGGEVLANTVTMGIVSALERTSVQGGNTFRQIAYIQHSAAINSGNSGGGLFNYKGQLIGINTLKYSGNMYTGTYEGLGFAIPSDMVMEITNSLIEHGKVIRPQMGVVVVEWDGPDEPTPTWPQACVYVKEVVEGGPAEKAGFEQYDFIYSVDGVRVKNMTELTTQMDMHEAGDTVEVVVVRYADLSKVGNSNNSSSFYYGFGGYSRNTGSDFEFVTLKVTLEILDD